MEKEILELVSKVLENQGFIMEQLEELKEQHQEVREALANISLPGRDYSVDEFPEY